MKKNLRIVSAAAAALLAVAPVAATGVTTVLADTPVTVAGGSQTTTSKATLKLSVTNALALADGDAATKATASLATPELPAGATVTVSQAKIYNQADVTSVTDGAAAFAAGKTADSNVANVASGSTYVAIAYVTITGLKANTQYEVNGSSAAKAKADNTGTIANFAVLSDAFTVSNPALTGAPYVREAAKGTTGPALSSGSYDLTSADYSVKALAKALVKTATSSTGKYEPAVTTNKENATGTTAATAKFADVEGDIRTSLKAAGVTVKSDANGSFDKPAAPFVVTLTVVATNGQKTTFAVTVDPNSSVVDATYPVIKYFEKGTPKTFPDLTVDKTSSKVIEDVDSLTTSATATDSINFNYVPVNGVVDTAAIKKAFTAQVNKDNTNTLDPTVDVSKVNTKVAGKYPVTVSATNAEKKTTKVTFYLTVGVKGATYKTVQSDGDVPVYKIEGNTVTDTKTTVKNGDQIAVFGDAIKVGDKSYTRINSSDSNLYVESKYVDGSFKPAEKTKKTIMHNAYIYDKDHKRVGTSMLKAYSTVEVIGKTTTKLADGSLVYEIGDNQYVMADNIDGTSRVLGHNAYVYKTSKKRANSKKLLKGSTVTTYGSPYKFKNGKLYYRIGGPAKQYVKVANFR